MTVRIAPLVLIVDDHQASGDLYSIALNASGFQTCATRDGHKALEVALTRRPAAIVTDIATRQVDGWRLIERLNTERARDS